MQQRDAAVSVHVHIQIGMHHALQQHVIGTRLQTLCQYILTAQAPPKQSADRGLLLVNYNIAQEAWAAMLAC